MRAFLTVRNVRCTIRCCVPPIDDELEGVQKDVPTGKLSRIRDFFRKRFGRKETVKNDFEPIRMG